MVRRTERGKTKDRRSYRGRDTGRDTRMYREKEGQREEGIDKGTQ